MAQFCLDQGVVSRWRSFMEEHSPAFAGCDGEAYSLAHTQVHVRFCSMVEESLEAHLATLGHCTNSFAALCQAGLCTSNGDADPGGELQPLVAAFSELLSMATEFVCFSDAMRDSARRDYFFSILRMWQGALSTPA